MMMQDVIVVGRDDKGELVTEAEWKFHTEAVQRVADSWQSQLSKTRPATYTDPLVTGRYYNRDELASLREVAYGDPIGSALTTGMVEAALMDGWRFVKEHGDDDEVDGAERIHQDFDMCHAQHWLKEVFVAAKAFGHALLYTGPQARWTQDVQSSEETSSNKLDVFTPEYFDLPEHGDGDAKIDPISGTPKQVLIRPNPNDSQYDQWVDYSYFIHVYHIRKGRSYDAYPALYKSWSYITLIRHTMYNLGWAMQKFGTGAMMIFLSGRLTPETEAALKAGLQKASQQRAGVLDANLVDRIEYIGPTGNFSNNIPESVELMIKIVAAAHRVPVSFLLGESGGSSGSAPTEDKQFYDSIGKDQQKFAPVIKELARRRGHRTDWVLDYNAVFAKDEREAAEIRVLNAQALSLEKQAERGDIMISMQGQGGQDQPPQKPKDADKTNNQAGVQ